MPRHPQYNPEKPQMAWRFLKSPETACSRRTYTPAYIHRHTHTYKHVYIHKCTHMHPCNHNQTHSAKNTPPSMDLISYGTAIQVHHLGEDILHVCLPPHETQQRHSFTSFTSASSGVNLALSIHSCVQPN